MGKEFTYRAGEFLLYCEVRQNLIIFDDDFVVITLVSGDGSVLKIPETIEVDGTHLTVEIIDKKACLGHKGLTRVELPSTMKRLEDWAFAQCDNLRTVRWEGGQDAKLRFGRGVFQDCRRIHTIALSGDENDAMAALLGALPYRLEAEYLLCAEDIGSVAWYEKWDQSLCMFLLEDDEEGYTNVVLCGEEDIQSSVTEFVSDKRKSKSALCMLRLVNDSYLTEEVRQNYIDYLLAHTKGTESEDSWLSLLDEHGDNMAYYKLFAEIGAINRDNVDAMIMDMADSHPEAKAYVMRYKQEHLVSGDVFDAFEL